MMTNILGMLIAAVAIVPAPREQVWRGGPEDYRGNGQRYGPYFYSARIRYRRGGKGA